MVVKAGFTVQILCSSFFSTFIIYILFLIKFSLNYMKLHSKLIIIGRKQDQICKKGKSTICLIVSCIMPFRYTDCCFRLFLHSRYKYTYFVLFNNNFVGASEMVTMETESALSWVLVPNISIPNFIHLYTSITELWAIMLLHHFGKV